MIDASSLARARGAVAAGAFHVGLRAYRAHLRREPGDLEARRELREVQRTLVALAGRARGARKEPLREALEEGVRAVDEEQPWSAMERLEDLLEVDPALESAHLKLARAAHRGGLRQVAVQAFRDALALDPSNAPALRGLFRVSLEAGAYGRAQACLRRLERVCPQDPDLSALARELDGRARASEGRGRVARAMGEHWKIRLTPRPQPAPDALDRYPVALLRPCRPPPEPALEPTFRALPAEPPLPGRPRPVPGQPAALPAERARPGPWLLLGAVAGLAGYAAIGLLRAGAI